LAIALAGGLPFLSSKRPAHHATAANRRRHMKPNGKIAALVVVACAVVGCSKRGETQKTTAEDSTPKAIAASESTTPKAFDGEGFAGTTAPKISGPVSFADGEAAYRSKNYAEAVTLFEAYTTRKPKNAWGHYMLGLSAWKSGDLVKSETAFQTALGIDPMHMKSHVNLSRVLIEQKRYDDAVEQLAKASEVDPESVTVQRLMARVFTAQHKTDEAIEAYRRAIALDELDAWSMNNLGLLYLEQGFTEDAVPYFARAAELKTNVPVFFNNLGMALEHKGRFVAAAEAYKGALAADPGYAKAKQNLVRVEAVKSGPEEPFDLAALARGIVEERKVAASDETRASK
jgi:Flp pilus assembly protein TadD